MLIGISGKRGSGKTTIADYLSLKYGFKKLSFANRLKEVARQLFPFSNEDFTNPTKKESNFQNYDWTPRDFLIGLGCFVRQFDLDYWTKSVLSQCKPTERYVIDDVRFPNEFNLVRAENGILIRVNRSEDVNIFGKNLNDTSEDALDHKKTWDLVINNNSTSLPFFYRSLETDFAHVLKLLPVR